MAADDGIEEGLTMKIPALRRALAGFLLAAALLAPSLAARAAGPAPAQQDFATAQDAVDALISALQQNDKARFATLMGPAGERLLESGDPVADDNTRKSFLADYAEKHSLAVQSDGRAVLSVGSNGWPMPIPLVQANGKWHFDTQAGAQEVINRRIGRNEIGAIRTALAFADAQNDYKSRFGTFAQRLYSTPGQHDGLYWEPVPGELESPMGPLVDQAVDEGYPGAEAAGKQVPYHGYLFHMLKGQGPSAPGGKRSYLTDGKLTGGVGLVAWPAAYGSSGIMTFLVNQDGVVFQKDLGPDTARKVAAITAFDPDLSWARVDVTP